MTTAENRATLQNGEDNWTTAMEVEEEEQTKGNDGEPQQFETEENDDEDDDSEDVFDGATQEVQNEVIRNFKNLIYRNYTE